MTHSRTDIAILFATRITRLFAYGFLSVILVLYLVQVGLHEFEIGLLLTLTLAGDAIISLWITTSADRIWQAAHAHGWRTVDGLCGHRLCCHR
jgi:hypothetical protein